jgi:hypothetical protein
MPDIPLKEAPKPSDVAESIGERFDRLARQWKANRGPTSSLSKIASDPAYQEIILMGEAVVPCILAALDAEPDFWFAALRRISGANPIIPDVQGELHAMAKAWLEWGRGNNVRW